MYKEKSYTSFEHFHQQIVMRMNEYIINVRFSLKNPSCSCKNLAKKSRNNNYNEVLLNNWGVDMDIQFILVTYTCVSYIISDIYKGQIGLSNLSQDACKEARKCY